VSEINKIQDIQSFRKVVSDAKNLEALKKAMPILHPALELMGSDTDQIERALKEIDGLTASVEDLITIPDRFNDHLHLLAGLCMRRWTSRLPRPH